MLGRCKKAQESRTPVSILRNPSGLARVCIYCQAVKKVFKCPFASRVFVVFLLVPAPLLPLHLRHE